MPSTIKKNDLVKILSGKDRGKTGRALKVFPRENRIMVEGLNLRKRHRRARKQGEKGQIVTVPVPMHISNTMLICPSCSKAQRAKISAGGGEKFRICRKCGVKIP